MKLTFDLAGDSDVPELVALHTAVAKRLTLDFGPGRWSSCPTEGTVLHEMRRSKFSRTLVARNGKHILGTLRLATKKPWAIDVSYFTPVKKPLYLTGMAVQPDSQREGIGRLLLQEAEHMARAWPADTIRLDAFDAPAGAGTFYAKCGYREVAHVSFKNDPLIYFELLL